MSFFKSKFEAGLNSIKKHPVVQQAQGDPKHPMNLVSKVVGHARAEVIGMHRSADESCLNTSNENFRIFES